LGYSATNDRLAYNYNNVDDDRAKTKVEGGGGGAASMMNSCLPHEAQQTAAVPRTNKSSQPTRQIQKEEGNVNIYTACELASE